MPWGVSVSRVRAYSRSAFVLGMIALLVAGGTQASHLGIGGDADEVGDVSIAGCPCHSEESANSVTVLIEGLPYHYEAGGQYELTVQLIGGPDPDTSSNTAGFSMMVSSGTLGAGEGYESMVQNWEDDPARLTHTSSGAKTEDRSWHILWTAPATGEGAVTIWLAGNSVNGDQVPSALDNWNRLSTTIEEGADDGSKRTVFSGNGEIEPPAAAEHGVHIHEMGAGLRAHWLGLLGFAAVIIVLLFCGLFLRYGFSRHYEGRSNLLRLRIKHLRRGDQL